MLKNRKYVVYCIENTVTHRKFIGYSAERLEERLQRHVNLAFLSKSRRNLHRNIRKYGNKCFRIEALEYWNSREKAIEAVKFYKESMESPTPLS